VYAVRRRDAYGAYALVSGGVPFVIARLASLDRYLALVLPVYWLVARAALPLRLAWAVGSAIVLVALSYLTFRLRLPP
jgi:zona occludens toxin (predicted ATPase)